MSKTTMTRSTPNSPFNRMAGQCLAQHYVDPIDDRAYNGWFVDTASFLTVGPGNGQETTRLLPQEVAGKA